MEVREDMEERELIDTSTEEDTIAMEEEEREEVERMLRSRSRMRQRTKRSWERRMRRFSERDKCSKNVVATTLFCICFV